ncbi:hypothetical protein CHGG_08409 [Chaetomium globosum CBS 148.51]|uniref:Meiotically up-regulated gene 157 protein n=1 Tax=Chaetomium globosum (strain ATCC 6205 / CBS 148.51 / DSM 1962 / NBRC 6347 / NRRL 1970) TaxID=306901 RepID=Q2GUE5_CHAGB|nr:uncharacterized protein CHGG_08409 [Chaetomium globosum CBS 148.51]EAQ84395.1 hypothetical protein CHGG_08409 [Chaetomium globosum CBS 148.51]
MKTTRARVLLAGLLPSVAAQSCPDYSDYSKSRHEPFSSGKHALSSMRPAADCRTFNSTTVETLLANMTEVISDPDLYRLFENTYPNTLDTTVRWRGHAADNPDEELAFLITGDIDAMWLRDSANQLQSYLPLLEPDAAPNDPTSIASLYRGLSASYYEATHDAGFFARFAWLRAIRTLLDTTKSMTAGTYGPAGEVLPPPYSFTRLTTRATETLLNDGVGAPVRRTGMVRSAFRPSDDATTYPFLVPANMLFARALAGAGLIVSALEEDGEVEVPEGLAKEMAGFSAEVRAAIVRYGVVTVPVLGGNGTETETVYAYEVDGYGSAAIMDDANVPSLLAAPVFGYLGSIDPVYQRTRKRLLSAEGNPYFMAGKVINAIGGPHAGPGMAWPMASVVRILTSEDDEEIEVALRELVASTDGLGLIHESINSNDATKWTRQWFSWANGLFGQMILDLRFRKPHILQKSFQ